ncbi:AAA domain-containing protein [Xenorhabdus sp. XENO-1]|uniref:AAA domain-containing protein n=1 Tax=Xenorhabdus bovienii TaxID=40576 RepID=UPI0020CA7AE9|nr:AAA domain-containing protein [Xenorhabdus bovienii]MCP9268901.1 AAA domain-containing protein [Xenorhabdus bovienii subsp. africana]
MTDNNILDNYEIVEDNILKTEKNKSIPHLILSQKDGENYIIKYWPRNITSDEQVLESIWQHELRQLQRLKGYPGVGDYIVYPVESKKTNEGFYLVLNSDGRVPASYLLNRKTLSLPRNSHWLTRLKDPTVRIRFWKNICRITNAIGLLHAQGLLHRHLDENSILTYEYEYDDYNDFQLTGFEWSIRMPTLTTAKIKPVGEQGKISTFATDWIDLGILISKFLKIDLSQIKNLSFSAEHFISNHDLTISEVTIIRSLLGIQPIQQNAIKELLSEKEILHSIDRIINELTEFYKKTKNIHGVAINTKYEQTNNNKEKKDLFHCIQKTFYDKNNFTISRDDSEIIKNFVCDDLSDSPVLFVNTLETNLHEVILKGKELCYVLTPFQPDHRTKDKTWELGYSQYAYLELPARFFNKENYIEINSNNISCFTHYEARKFLSNNDDSLNLIPWNLVFAETGKDKNKRNENHLKLLEGLTAVHIANIAYAKAEIFPVDNISEDSEPDNVSSWILKFVPRHDEATEELSKSLGIESPSVRLEKIINSSDNNDKLSWSLVNNKDFSKVDDEILLEFYGYENDANKQDIYSFISKKPLPEWKEFFIVPDSLEGTLRQITRHANTLDMLENHVELMNVITSPQSHLLVNNEEIIAKDIMASLDESKQKVFSKVLSTLPMNLVQGPPGVGKTHLVKALSQFIFKEEPNSRILFTAQNHATVQHLYHEVVKDFTNQEEHINSPIIVRCNKVSGEDNVVLNSADETGLDYLGRFVESDLFRDSSNHKLKNDIDNLLKASPVKRYPLINQLIKSASLIFATTNSDYVERMIKERAQFDWSIMEESGKVTGIELISPLLLSYRRLMIGDHHQLPPYRSIELKNILVNNKKLTNTFEEVESINNFRLKNELIRNGHFSSINGSQAKEIGLRATRFVNLFESLILADEQEDIRYEQLFGKDKIRKNKLSSMLSVQHRMHPYIAEVISNVFYKDKLVTDKDKERKYLDEDFDAVINLKEESALKNKPPIIWINQPDIQRVKGSRSGEHKPIWSNENECKAVISLLKDLDKNATPTKKMKLVVLSPYSNQVKLISKSIEIEKKKNGFKKLLNNFIPPDDNDGYCLTVDSFQGGEADIVIISLVRNNGKSTIKSALGFLSDQRRINVLLSRAKHKLIIIGSYDFLKSWSNRIAKENLEEYDFIPKLTKTLDLSLSESKLASIEFEPIGNKGKKNGK